jgi:hypothetical protein
MEVYAAKTKDKRGKVKEERKFMCPKASSTSPL